MDSFISSLIAPYTFSFSLSEKESTLVIAATSLTVTFFSGSVFISFIWSSDITTTGDGMLSGAILSRSNRMTVILLPFLLLSLQLLILN